MLARPVQGSGAVRVLVACALLLVPLGSGCDAGNGSGDPACPASTEGSGGSAAATTCADTGTGGGY